MNALRGRGVSPSCDVGEAKVIASCVRRRAAMSGLGGKLIQKFCRVAMNGRWREKNDCKAKGERVSIGFLEHSRE